MDESMRGKTIPERRRIIAAAREAASNGQHHDEPAPDPQPPLWPEPIPSSKLKLADPSVSKVWSGLLGRGEVTLFSALMKSGKTTLLAHLLKALGPGGTFLDRAVLPSRVLYITEESENRWAIRRDNLGLEDHVEFLIRPFHGKPVLAEWMRFVSHVTELCKANKYDVVVLDTISNLWPVKDENSACEVQAALMPLHRIVGEGVALMPVHHVGKADLTEGRASRGSTALTGFVDTILELRRFDPTKRDDRRRVLAGYGRDDDTPQEITIELTDEGYVVCESRLELAMAEISAIVAGIIPTVPPGLTANEILKQWPGATGPRGERFGKALKAGAEEGRWHREGGGKNGSPYRYWGAPETEVF